MWPGAGERERPEGSEHTECGDPRADTSCEIGRGGLGDFRGRGDSLMLTGELRLLLAGEADTPGMTIDP